MFKAFKHFQWHDNIRLDYSVGSYTWTMNPTNCENKMYKTQKTNTRGQPKFFLNPNLKVERREKKHRSTV